MLRLLRRRLIGLVPLLLLVSFGVFLLLALVPGDPAVTLAGGDQATPASIARVRNELHLNDPLLSQYGRWLSGVAHFDFGKSIASGIPVSTELGSRLPVTLSLVLAATVVALVVGIPLGIVSGAKPGSAVDSIARGVSSVAIAVPGFWLAVILVSLFAVRWHLLPPTGFTRLTDSPAEWARHIVLPAVSLGLLVGASLARQLRAGMLDVLDSNYIRTAWAKGASTRRVILRHVLQNAAIPAITVLGINIAYLVGGAVITEQIFSIPGVGTYLLQGIVRHDLPVVQGVALVFVVFQLTMSLLVDMSYGLLDPRVRVG